MPAVTFHPHAIGRAIERGATLDEIVMTVEQGQRFPAKFGRTGFRRSFDFNGVWRGRTYAKKQVEAYAIIEDGNWLVLTVITKYF
jgi:hypothetical protein